MPVRFRPVAQIKISAQKVFVAMFNPDSEANLSLIKNTPSDFDQALIYLTHLTSEQLNVLYQASIEGLLPEQFIKEGFTKVILHQMLPRDWANKS